METTVLLISLAIIPVLLIILALCIKLKTSKSNPDLFGLAGTLKSTESEDAYLPPNHQERLNVSSGSEDRTEVRTPSYERKLPELPNDEHYKGKDDSNSELYATVDEMPTNNNSLRMSALSRRPNINMGSQSSHHPYAQVKKTRRQEHPYASVGEVTSGEGQEAEEEEDTEEYETAEHLLDSGRSIQDLDGRSSSGRGRGTWVPPPRRPEEGRGASRQTTPLPPEPAPEQHFSGDSQDSFSAKGYTSISVREPLANLSRPSHSLEGNYVTLSETSDEMYAAIEETVYTHPGGAPGGSSEAAATDMYSKVDKAKKRGKSLGPELRTPTYATVSKGVESNPLGMGARPKQRSPCPTSHTSLTEGVDYSEYEVAHSDCRGGNRLGYDMNRSYHESYPASRDLGYQTVPYADSGLSEREPGYEIVPQVRNKTSGSRDPQYETLVSESRDPGYESVPQRNRVNSLDPGYETVPQKSQDPNYASVTGRGPRLDPGYETVPHNRLNDKRRSLAGANYGPRSFPPDDYESVLSREPGYETLPEVRRDEKYHSLEPSSYGREGKYHSLEPGYEILPEVRPEPEVQYSRVNKKGPRAAPPHPSPPRTRLYSGSEVNYETLPEPRTRDEAGYETIPANQRLPQYDPGYETLPAMRLPSEPGYETIPGVGMDSEDMASEAATTDPDYARLKEADIEFIDESADELDDELGRLQTDEDVTVESSQSSSLIHMSVVESGIGVRRSSVVVIEHVDMTPVPSRASEGGSDVDMDVNTHIFV